MIKLATTMTFSIPFMKGSFCVNSENGSNIHQKPANCK